MEYKDAIQTKDLQLHIDQLKEEMRRKQYSDFEIREMDYVWQNLLSYAKQNPVERFDEAYRQKFLNDIYAKEMESRDSMYRITRAMNMLSDFIYFRVIFRQYCTPKTDFSEEYHDAFHSFIESEKRRNLSKIAIRTIFVRLMRFHDYLIDIGVYNLNELSVEHINQYILSLARYSTTYTSDALRTLRRFFTYAHENNYCKESFAHCIPHVKNLRQQKLPTIFSSEEIEKILGTIDRHNPIGKRNYAIIMLAVRTGLRSGDIQNLTFSNINWDEKSLNLLQSKTGIALSLPLAEDVGWALIDYLKNGRPETQSQKIFVSHTYPYDELSTLGNIVPRQMRKAGIKSPSNKRVGMHSFRHTLATRMLEEDIPLPIVSQTLGHADINSTGVYLRISIKQLSKCGLEVDL